jgi:hypothetical protein
MDVTFILDPCSGSLKPLSVTNDFYKSIFVSVLYANALPTMVECVIPVTLIIYVNYKLISALQSSGVGTGLDKRQRQSASVTRRNAH